MRASLAALVLVVSLSRGAGATAFTVQPIRVELDGQNKSTLLTIANGNLMLLRLQVRAFAWDQDPNGHMKLEPTSDIVFFPRLFEVAAGGQSRLRVGSLLSTPGVEKAYRLFIRELPSEPSPEGAQESRLDILTEVGIPVFIGGKGQEPRVVLETEGIADGHVAFRVRNTGPAHFMLDKVRIEAQDAAGTYNVAHELPGWYVLAGGERAFRLPLPGCLDLQSVLVTATANQRDVTDEVAVTPETCSAPHR